MAAHTEAAAEGAQCSAKGSSGSPSAVGRVAEVRAVVEALPWASAQSYRPPAAPPAGGLQGSSEALGDALGEALPSGTTSRKDGAVKTAPFTTSRKEDPVQGFRSCSVGGGQTGCLPPSSTAGSSKGLEDTRRWPRELPPTPPPAAAPKRPLASCASDCAAAGLIIEAPSWAPLDPAPGTAIIVGTARLAPLCEDDGAVKTIGTAPPPVSPSCEGEG